MESVKEELSTGKEESEVSVVHLVRAFVVVC